MLGGVLLTYYTTTKEFQDAWNRAIRGIENVLGDVSNYVKSKAKSLAKEIGVSFSKAKKKYKKGETEDHQSSYCCTKSKKSCTSSKDIIKS